MVYGRPRKRGHRGPIPKEPGSSRSKLADAIAQARRAAGLTQAQLGRRLGLKGRAVYRWERDESAPTKRNRVALVTALTAVRPELGAWFAQVITVPAEGPSSATVAPAEPAAPSPADILERAVFALADELDLPPRRARGALKRLVERLGAANLSIDALKTLLEEWIRRAE